jgi:hypothetical protein
VADRVWRVDIEFPRDSVTGRRRRVSRTVRGSKEDAEFALARLKLAGLQPIRRREQRVCCTQFDP